MIFTILGVAILAIVGFWLFGGVVLRVAGVVFVFVGLVSLVTLADPAALLMVVIGSVMWLAGHWHFALRHHEYKSPLAQRIFLQVLPPRYDPTRHWGTRSSPSLPSQSEVLSPSLRPVRKAPVPSRATVVRCPNGRSHLADGSSCRKGQGLSPGPGRSPSRPPALMRFPGSP